MVWLFCVVPFHCQEQLPTATNHRDGTSSGKYREPDDTRDESLSSIRHFWDTNHYQKKQHVRSVLFCTSVSHFECIYDCLLPATIASPGSSFSGGRGYNMKITNRKCEGIQSSSILIVHIYQSGDRTRQWKKTSDSSFFVGWIDGQIAGFFIGMFPLPCLQATTPHAGCILENLLLGGSKPSAKTWKKPSFFLDHPHE